VFRVVGLVAVSEVIVGQQRERVLMLRIGMKVSHFVKGWFLLWVDGHAPHGATPALGPQQLHRRVFVDKATKLTRLVELDLCRAKHCVGSGKGILCYRLVLYCVSVLDNPFLHFLSMDRSVLLEI
jgi:hypothetical protein